MEATESHPSEQRILVVDDTPEILALLVKILAQSGFSVQAVPSAKMALQEVDDNPPDLVLLDVNMPEMNGYQLCERWKADPRTKDIPVIFVSGLEGMSEKIQGFQAGGVDYITKPFHNAEVVARVGTHLQLRRAMQTIQKERARVQAAHEHLSRAMNELRSGIDMAAEIQRSMLPPSGLHSVRSVMELAATYLPQSSVGGDFFDFATVDDNHIAFILADVCGHGLHAAYITGLIKTSFVLAGERRLAPGRFLEELNGLLCGLTPASSFATLVCCVYDSSARTLRYVNAGHAPLPILASPGASPSAISTATNPLLGIFPSVLLLEETIHMPSGATLLLATDGLTDARNAAGQRFGYERLLAAVDRPAHATAAEVEKAVLDEFVRFCGGTSQDDDIAMMTVRFL